MNVEVLPITNTNYQLEIGNIGIGNTFVSMTASFMIPLCAIRKGGLL